MTIAQIYEEAKRQLDKGVITIGEFSEIVDREYQEPSRWIPVSERLPKELEPVNITWVNHNPQSYYANIKEKPFTATGVYFNGQWYWWSTLCTDILAEYSHNYSDIIDDDIEITAWMPLPEPYKIPEQTFGCAED